MELNLGYLMKVFFLLAFVITEVLCDYSQNRCEWTGSGLHIDPADRIIQQVYLQCEKGSVEWKFPRSAIRVTYQFLNSHQDFRLCIRPTEHSSGANIYKHPLHGELIQLISDDRPELKKIGVVPENQLRLIVQNELHRTNPREIHCFESEGGKASLYLEASTNPLSLSLITKFDYVLEPLQSHPTDLLHHYDDCRKCNATEIARSFCASDFVIKARMLDITNDITSAQSYIDVSVNHVYRQRDVLFTPSVKGRYRGAVIHPLVCGTVKESAHYLMTGSIVLGQAKLGCIMRFQEAKRLFLQLSNLHMNECDLSEVINNAQRRSRYSEIRRLDEEYRLLE